MSEPDEPDLELFVEPEADDDEEEDPAPRAGLTTHAPRPRQRPLRVIAVSGAKGGVGKSLLAANLALYLASIGRRVVVVDADADGANIHTFLGIERSRALAPYVPPSHAYLEPSPPEPEVTVEVEGEDAEDADLVPTAVPGLLLLHAGVDEPVRGQTRRTRREALMARIRELDAEYVVVDLGSSMHRTLLDAWLAADLSLFVTLPEPTSIENTYRFIRFAFARYLRGRATDVVMRKKLAERLRDLDGAPAPLDLLRALEDDGDPLAGFVRRVKDEFRFRVVLNQTRLRADLELGDRMRSAVRRRLAVTLDYLGYIDDDDTVWSCVRMRRALLVESPGTKASRSIEKIARRVLAIDSGKYKGYEGPSAPAESHHDLLEVDRGANDEEIRRAHKRAREVYSPDSLCCYGLFDPQGLSALRGRLDEAYDVLLDPARRRPYELSVYPPEPQPASRPRADEADDPAPPPPVITPDTEFTGALVRAVRESQRIDIRDVSQKTKIGVRHLAAIEADDFDLLPATVYVRGFVTEVAKFLKLDPDQVSRTYLRRYTRHREEQDKR